MRKAIKTDNGWIICGVCGSKLARVAKDGETNQTIEFKCSNCKTIIIYECEGKDNER